MKLRSTGILPIALAGALLAGGSMTMTIPGNLTGALDHTKAASLPNQKAPGTLPARTVPLRPHTPVLAEGKDGFMTYGSAPDTLPTGHPTIGHDNTVSIHGDLTVIRPPRGTEQLALRNGTLQWVPMGG